MDVVGMGMLLTVIIGALLAQIEAPGSGHPQTISVITSIDEVLRATNPQALHGRRVEWSGVQVQRVMNSEVILVGTKDRQVVLHRAQTQPLLNPGDVVNVTGILN